MPSEDDQILEGLAIDGRMEYAEWPRLLDQILPKLEHIAYNDFPMPRVPLPDFIPSSQKEELTPIKREPFSKEESPTQKPSAPEEAALESRERDEQDSTPNPPTKDSPANNIKRTRSSKPPPSNSIVPPHNTLPPPLLSLLQTIQSTLSTCFPTSPPHTAQRLAELLLRPKTHYRTLPSYLRALDRIVSVASPASIFPLPDLTVGGNTNHNTLLNGTLSPSPDDPTSDRDFIGGAELTEIPWLRTNAASTPPPSTSHNSSTLPTSDLRTESTRLIDGPNGAGSVETVSVSVNVNGNGVSTITSLREEAAGPGITQGELLRQEQEAGIVPVPSSPTNSRITRSNSAAATAAATRAVGLEPSSSKGEGQGMMGEGGEADREPEVVHARGPGVIGMEDMGPQAPGSGLAGGLDLEGALGRRGEGEGSAVGRREEEKEEEKDGDGDVVIADADADADAVTEGEEGVDTKGMEKGVDASDGTSL